MLVVKATGKNGVVICYDLEWLANVMKVSANSMVPFRFFHKSPKDKFKPRSYPRSDSPGFFLSKEKQIDDSDSAGGRQKSDEIELESLLQHFDPESMGELLVPLADIAILSKRAVCIETRRRRPPG